MRIKKGIELVNLISLMSFLYQVIVEWLIRFSCWGVLSLARVWLIIILYVQETLCILNLR